MIKKKKLFTLLFFVLVTSIISTSVSLRDISLVDDNIYYINNFIYTTSFSNFQYEFLFELITFFIRLFTENYIVYFFILNVILNFIIFHTGIKISNYYNIRYDLFIPILVYMMVLSSWYFTLATNGLRQGLSLAICYLALTQLILDKNFKKFFLLSIVSCLFHYSSILIMPFIALYKLDTRRLLYISIFTGFLYVLGFNEELVRTISNISNIPLYSSIKSYVDDADSYRYGFQGDLFIYTLGLSIIYYFINKLFLSEDEDIDKLIKIYLILTFPYYIFGFAAFSNRYGIMSWFFSIFLNAIIIYFISKRNKSAFYMIFICTFFISILYFLYRYIYTI